MLKRNVEPCFFPGDVAHMQPPMASTSLLHIANPSPEPPCCLVLDESTWTIAHSLGIRTIVSSGVAARTEDSLEMLHVAVAQVASLRNDLCPFHTILPLEVYSLI